MGTEKVEIPEIWGSKHTKVAHIFADNNRVFSICDRVAVDDTDTFMPNSAAVEKEGFHWCPACHVIYAETSELAASSSEFDEIDVLLPNGVEYTIPKDYLPIAIANGGTLVN